MVRVGAAVVVVFVIVVVAVARVLLVVVWIAVATPALFGTTPGGDGPPLLRHHPGPVQIDTRAVQEDRGYV
eukprot:3565327-Karenia_brevis.AAC.1